MKNLQIEISLSKYLKHDGELKVGQVFLLGNIPCAFVSKRMKNYRRYPESKPVKVMHYKVKVVKATKLAKNLEYAKGEMIECFDTEPTVPLMVKDYDTFSSN